MNAADNSVSVIDTTTNTVTSTVGVGSGPYGVAVSSDGSRVYVANAGSNTVSVIVTDQTPVFTTAAALPAGTVGTGYSQTIAATGTPAVTSYTVTSGALPAGLTLNTATGVLSGTPSAAGSYSFTVTATNSAVTTANTATREFTLTVVAGVPGAMPVPGNALWMLALMGLLLMTLGAGVVRRVE